MEDAFELALDRFPAFNHEPYYKDYAATNLVELFEEAGLRHEATATAWVSKTMVFSKPFDGQENQNASSAAAVEPTAVVVEDAVEETPANETVEAVVVESAPEEDEPEIGTRKF